MWPVDIEASLQTILTQPDKYFSRLVSRGALKAIHTPAFETVRSQKEGGVIKQGFV